MGIAREAVRAEVSALRDESRDQRGAFLPSHQRVAPSPHDPSSPTPHSLTPAPIRYLELDVTEDCVLRCTYCFRRNKQPHRMSWETAKAAVDWFMEASGDQKRISIYFFGGEPLMCFDLIKQVVPYAEREAAKRGKRVHCGATTNAVLVDEEVIKFWREHGMSFNTSIDGTPECHDRFRRFPDGRGSYTYVERGVRQVLAYRPQTTARCTLHPENAHRALESVLNLVKVGYENIPLIAIDDCPWTEEQYAAYREQLAKLSDLFIAR
ncbi:MAG: radical SAM protein [Planctomycetes bacterium]|nr:radical SAM protein [Planctomycetota bacterium]